MGKTLGTFLLLTLTQALLNSQQGCEAITIRLDDRVVISWELIQNNTAMEFEVTATNTGYIGIGFSYNGAMAGADILVMGVRDGTPYLEDRHGIGNEQPVLDESNDYHLLEAEENGTHTRVKFWRLLKTCDDHDMPITDDTVKIIWSLGATDTLTYHGDTNRGARATLLLDPDLNPPDMSHYASFDFPINITMPKDTTRYWCSIHKTPKLPEGVEHHMVAVAPIIDSPDAKRHIHHMNVLRCLVIPGFEDRFEAWVDKEGTDCHNPVQGFPDSFCLFLEYGWAIGGEMTTNPPDVGFPWEGETYFKLEVHYDNPTGRENVHFNSGLRVYYTDKKRPIEGHQLMLIAPTDYHLMVPPNQTRFISTTHCAAACTAHNLNETGIFVYSVFLHAHLSAQAMKVRHFRDGKELHPIVDDKFYDFNYQQNRRLRQEVQVLPGDHFMLECTYDTHWKNGKAVIGGQSTSEEMCMAFLAYYPRVPNFIGCASTPMSHKVLNSVGITALRPNTGKDPIVEEPESLRGMRFTQVVENFNWTDEARAEYQRVHRFEPHIGYCFPLGPPFVSTYPHFEEYVPPQECEIKENPENPPSSAPATFVSVFSFIVPTLMPFFLVK